MRFQQSYRIGASTLTIKLGDLATARTDVIVTSDDQELSMGGGTSKAVRRAAGESVYQAARSLVPVALGGVAVTPSGDLAGQGVLHVFHAATIPSSSERAVEDPAAVVAAATRQAIELVYAMKLNSIALPALGTGFAGFDPVGVAIAMSGVIREALTATPAALEVEIWLKLGTKRDDEAIAFFSEFTKRAELGSAAVRSHCVVLVHGIRTAMGWRERIGNELENANPLLTPIPVGYEFFDVVRFLLPIGPSRRTAAETVWKKMKSVFDNPNFDRVSIIAHSFGTWIVGYLLQTKELRFHRVIFCGAILDSKFDWETVTRKVDHPHWSDAPNAYVLNDCGTKDIWPIFAKFATWGYGISGRWGFQNALVRDRFHEVDHSGFFQDGFATRNWVPALTATSLSKGVDRGIDPSMLVSLMTITKLPYILIVIAVIVIYLLRR